MDINTIRCTNCGSYWKIFEPEPPEIWIIKCPAGHYSSFTIETGVIVFDAKMIDTPTYIRRHLENSFPLVDQELDFIKQQKGEFFDCGFLRHFMGNNSPIQMLDLGKMLRPSEPNTLTDDIGYIYKLVISPNGVAYYRKVGKA